MRCKSCEYPLWQIKARQCPECGTPFLPSENEFTLNSVQFCCPHCGQDYYGTGEKGHLVPRSFACVKCATFIDMDQMVLLPTSGVTEKQTEVTIVPWVNRRGRNWFVAFFSTMGMALGNPRQMARAIPDDSPGTLAFGYGIIHAYLQLLVAGFPIFFLFGIGMIIGSGRGGYAAMVAVVLAVAVAAPVLLWLWIALTHLILRITGPVHSNMQRTSHAICYSAGNNFISIIPCIGSYFCWAGGLWWMISAGFMLAVAQNVRGWRAALAVAAPPLLAAAIVVGSIAALIYAETSQVSASMAASSGAMAQGQTRSLLYAMQGRMSDTTLAPMTHVSELMVDNIAYPHMFVDMASGTGWSTGRALGNKMLSVRVGGRTLNQWQGDARPQRVAAATSAAAALPADVVAYRVGDMVFTHSGVDLAKHTDGSLWLVIAWPADMDRSGALVTTTKTQGTTTTVSAPSRTEVVVGSADGGVVVVDLADFDAELADQNQRRAKAGLPPIPHPADVVDGVPVGASQVKPVSVPPADDVAPDAADTP